MIAATLAGAQYAAAIVRDGRGAGATYPAIARWLGGVEAPPGWKDPYDLLPGYPLPLHNSRRPGHNAADQHRGREQIGRMSSFEQKAAGLLAALSLLVGMSAAGAQQPSRPTTAPRPAQSAAPAPPSAEGQQPQRTTATYGDWVVRCEIRPGPPPHKTCDMEQLAQVQGQANPISRVAIPLPPKGETAKLFVQLPVNVSFAAPIKITADGKDPGITTPFRRCVPAGCFAELELKDELQKKFRGSAEPGKILFKDAGDHEVAIPLSFKGFSQAYEALLKQ